MTRTLTACLTCIVIALSTLSALPSPLWDTSNPGMPAGIPMVAANGKLFSWIQYENYSVQIREWTSGSGWQLIGGFSPRPDQTYAGVNAMVLAGSYLYVGGYFYGYGATNIAKYNITTSTWSPVGTPSPTQDVKAITVDNAGHVYIGDQGTIPPSQGSIDTEMFKMWNGSAWVTVGGGLVTSSLIRELAGVRALGTDGTNVYIAGDFDGASGITSYSLIRWSPSSSTWTSMVPNSSFWSYGAGLGPLFSGIVCVGTNIFVGGQFTGAANGIARFSAISAQNLPLENNLLSQYSTRGTVYPGTVNGLASYGNILYIAGYFDTFPSQMLTAYGVAQWSDGVWSVLAPGPGLTTEPVQGSFYPAQGTAVAADANQVFVSGDFDSVDGESAPNGSPVRWVKGGLVDLDFGPVGTASPKSGIAGTGISPNDFWNYAGMDQGISDTDPYTISNLKLSDGFTTDTSITIYAAGSWGSFDSFDPMLGTFRWSEDEVDMVLTLNNLSAGTYDLYLYGLNAPSGGNPSGSSFVVNGVEKDVTPTYYYNYYFYEGEQYVVYRDLQVSEGGSITINALAGTANVNGLQLVRKQ